MTREMKFFELKFTIAYDHVSISDLIEIYMYVGLCLHIEGLGPTNDNWHAKTSSTFIIDIF